MINSTLKPFLPFLSSAVTTALAEMMSRLYFSSDKIKQLENCYKVVKEMGLEDKIKQITLQFKKRESDKKSPQLRKVFLNPKIKNKHLQLRQSEKNQINC